MDKSYDVIADEAMKRRRESNTPWPGSCMGCGIKKKLSLYNPNVCDDCIKQAYDVLESMEK